MPIISNNIQTKHLALCQLQDTLESHLRINNDCDNNKECFKYFKIQIVMFHARVPCMRNSLIYSNWLTNKCFTLFFSSSGLCKLKWRVSCDFKLKIFRIDCCAWEKRFVDDPFSHFRPNWSSTLGGNHPQRKINTSEFSAFFVRSPLSAAIPRYVAYFFVLSTVW